MSWRVNTCPPEPHTRSFARRLRPSASNSAGGLEGAICLTVSMFPNLDNLEAKPKVGLCQALRRTLGKSFGVLPVDREETPKAELNNRCKFTKDCFPHDGQQWLRQFEICRQSTQMAASSSGICTGCELSAARSSQLRSASVREDSFIASLPGLMPVGGEAFSTNVAMDAVGHRRQESEHHD